MKKLEITSITFFLSIFHRKIFHNEDRLDSVGRESFLRIVFYSINIIKAKELNE